MAEKEGIGSKLLGLFVEKESTADPAADPAASGPAAEPTGEQSAAELVAELARKSGAVPPATKAAAMGAPGAAAPVAHAPSAVNLAPPPPGTAPAQVDFEAVFRQAGMDGAELDRVKKAEELLKSLPESTPHETKKQIVEASLRAFGFEIEKIVAAANNQKRAIDTYLKVNEQATSKGITDAEAQIKQLQEKIAKAQEEIVKRTSALAGLNVASVQRKAQVQKVLDFFAQPAAPQSPPQS